MYTTCGPKNLAFQKSPYLRYGDEEQYKDVKRDMVVAFESNKDACKKKIAFKIFELERSIKDSIDKISDTPIWFETLDCAQLLADAYDVPIFIYSFKEAVMTLPFKMPVKPKFRVQPYHLYNVKNNQWLAIKPDHLKTMYPVIDLIYFIVVKSYATLFKTTWNLFGQFPEYKENLLFNPETDELVIITSSDEE